MDAVPQLAQFVQLFIENSVLQIEEVIFLRSGNVFIKFINLLASDLIQCFLRQPNSFAGEGLNSQMEAKTAFCLFDAHFFGGNFRAAKRAVQSYCNDSERLVSVEACLKLSIADWFATSTHSISPVDERALQTFSSSRFESGEFTDSLFAQLALAIRRECDPETWANAILDAARSGSFEDVLLCSSGYCGVDAYLLFREKIAPALGDPSALRDLDALAESLNVNKDKFKPPNQTIRLVDEDNIVVAETH